MGDMATPAPPEPAPPPPDRPARGSWAPPVVTAGLLVLAAPVVAYWVLGQAVGEYAFDVFGQAELALLAWLAVPTAFLLVWGRLRRSPRWRAPVAAAAAVGAAVAALVFAGWLIRPTAPDGGDRPATREEGEQRLAAEVGPALDELATGRWHQVADTGERCLDTFGRNRGASHGAFEARVERGLDAAELDRAAARLVAAGWSRGPLPWSRALGFSATRDGYRLDLETRREPGSARSWTNVVGTTPCLRG
jgi:hypothetical protein